MYEIIKNMIEIAKKNKDYEQAENIKNLIDEMADTINCPFEWRDIGENLFKEYQSDDWVLDNCMLYEYEN